MKISHLVLKLSAKTRFSVAILNFYDQSGNKILDPINFTNHYHRSWKSAINILKISQLVLKLSAENQFSATILNFYDQTGSRFYEPIFFTKLYYWTWKFAIRILKISQLVLMLSAKNRFSAAILNFYDQTWNRILKSRLQGPIPGQTWSYAVWILKISLLDFELWGNNTRTDIHTDRHTYRQTELKYYIRLLKLYILAYFVFTN